MDIASELALFLGKAAGLAIIVVAASAALLVLGRRGSGGGGGNNEPRLQLRVINEQLQRRADTLREAGMPVRRLWQRRRRRPGGSLDDLPERRLFVLRFHGDIGATAVGGLREAVSAIVLAHGEQDRVLLVLESSGGVMHGYGLAASQLDRLRKAGLHLTVAVDKVAASGGYMMACVADRLVAAPFAIIGSIGVVGQLPNFHRLLKRHDIDFEQHTAGEYKRTLTLFGENTEADRAKFREDLAEAHRLFRDFIARHRPALDLDRVATGEYWFAEQALALGLVDELATSDDLVLAACQDWRVVEITASRRRSWLERLGGRTAAALGAFIDRPREASGD
jgi:serine protease SohB